MTELIVFCFAIILVLVLGIVVVYDDKARQKSLLAWRAGKETEQDFDYDFYHRKDYL